MPDIFDFEKVKNSPNFAVKNYKDSMYRGEIINSKRHGLGVITYSNNRVYEGEWMNDKRSGNGYEKFSNGNIYLGTY